MTHRHLPAALLLALAALTGLSACQSTPTQESTGQYMDDTATTTKVKAAIFNEPTLKSAEINVETFKGVVQLSGFVSSQADIATAVRARMQVNGLSEPVARLLVERGIAPTEGGFVWRSDPRLTQPTAVRISEAQVRDLVRHIECPTRVIYADPPQSYFPDDVRRTRAALLPRGELVVMPGTHHLHMEDPAGVAAAIGDFFRR